MELMLYLYHDNNILQNLIKIPQMRPFTVQLLSNSRGTIPCYDECYITKYYSVLIASAKSIFEETMNLRPSLKSSSWEL